MADEDSHSTYSSLSGDEGDSDPLRVTAEVKARLSTPAKATLVQIRLHIFASDQIIEERNQKEFLVFFNNYRATFVTKSNF